MTKIEFVLLAEGAQPIDVYDIICQRARLVCNGGGLYVHTRDEVESQAINQHLLANRNSDPIAHVIAGTIVSADTTVGQKDSDLVIGSNTEPDGSHRTLINTSLVVPWFFSRFETFIELVCAGENDRKMGRERYLYYKHRGYPLRHRQL